MQRIQGFTLLELMIVVAIVGIIAAIAYPAYQGQVLESRRDNAQQELLRLQLQEEAYRLQNNDYGDGGDIAVPVSDFYVFTISNATATTYTLTATAKGTQTKDTGCTTLTLNQSMVKTPANCW
ncbi:type IV pilin protein [Aliiglaciecola sp. CAU 1673]|uniref:type IV pilin protein n=1 Tax=Aliiglaciecola sp. CAU 1673 TaxID=3032595 RepID=UPI0023DC9FEE|nr:type IV pilin protein [Aliiglaciecola sp. CAU 1673]MDF2178220.1 type IV pilin protein [Aliiglaciecola sp. CAU 1673]